MIIWHLLVLHVCIQSSGPPMGKTVILNVDEETELERSANLLRVIELLQDEGCVWSQPAWLHPSHHDRITLEASSAWGSDIYWTSMGKSSLRCIVKDVHYMRLKYSYFLSILIILFFFSLSLSLYVSAYPFSWGLGPALHPLSFVSSTFWTPPNMFLLPFLFVFPQRFPLPFCLPKSLLLALCSMPVFFFFFSSFLSPISVSSQWFFPVLIFAKPNPEIPAGFEVSLQMHSMTWAPGSVGPPTAWWTGAEDGAWLLERHLGSLCICSH